MANIDVAAEVTTDDQEAKDGCISDECSSGSERSFEVEDTTAFEESVKVDHKTHNMEETKAERRSRNRTHGSRRQKGGSRHKHKGLLYRSHLKDNLKLQLQQKSLDLQEKENAAAVVRYEEAGQFVSFPVAPFNSTQFLMDEHSEHSPPGLPRSSASSVLSSFSPQDARINSVPSTPVESVQEAIFFDKKDKEFADIFTSAHAENLQSLPKAELVKHYINLEEKIAALQKKVAEAEHQRQDGDSYLRTGRQSEKRCACDSICNSDTNSLSSNNEEFVDLTVMNQHSTCSSEISLPGSAVSENTGNVSNNSTKAS